MCEERHKLRLALRGDVEEERGGGVPTRVGTSDVEVIAVRVARGTGFGGRGDLGLKDQPGAAT